MDPNVAAWFYAVDQDRSGHITATELQAALTNGNWSQFNPETCRMMIGMFDQDHSGTIGMHEFQALWGYIQQWNMVFQQFDRDRSGAIDGNELCHALNQMGYRLQPQLTQLMVRKYTRTGMNSIALDSFIQACVLLKSVTDTFKQKDAQMQGVININYEEFMTMCMLNKP